jgi:DNA-binding GntR family transcriptional regulator
VGRTLATDRERTCAVDGFAVDREPVTDPVQQVPFLRLEGAVRLRADVEQQRAVLAYHVEKIAQDHVGLDLEFHHAIARAAGNPLLSVLLDGPAAPTVRMRVWRGQTLPGVLERTLEEHRFIADALEAHDSDLAYAAATVHVAGLEAWVRTLKPGWSTLAAQHVHANGTPPRRLAEK